MAISSTAGPVQPYEQLFTSSGTWTVPAGVKTAEITVVGGSGGQDTNGTNVALSSAGFIKKIVDVSSSASYPIVIGAGGASGASIGGDGGQSSFGYLDGTNYGPLLVANGGSGRVSTTYATASGSSSYGSVISNTTDTNISNGFFPTTAYTSINYSTSTSTLPSSQTWTRIFLVNSRYFATNGTATWATSTDGSTWSTITIGAQSSARAKITYGNGFYVYAPGGGGSIYYSTNGTTWTLKLIASGYGYSVAYGPAGWIASSSTGTANIYKPATSGDPSTTWSSYSTTIGTSYTYLYAGTNYYYGLAIGSSADNTVYYSADGSSWASINLPYNYPGAGNSSSTAQSYGMFNNKLYIPTNASGTPTGITSVSGSTSTVVDSSATYNRVLENGIAVTSTGDTVYDITSNVSRSTFASDSTIKWVTANSYWTIPATASTTITKKTIASAYNTSLTSIAGVDRLGVSYSQYSGSGAGGPTPAMAVGNGTSAVTSNAGPGPGIDDWAWGCSISVAGSYGTMGATWSRGTYGSGVISGAGIQGVVRVRWWA